jgi:Ras-related GTP-binding protein C/D
LYLHAADIVNTSFFKFQIWDLPGKFETADFADKLGDADLIFRKSHAIVFVIDGQDDPYSEALDYLVRIAAHASKVNPNLFFEVFIHKIDGDAYLHEDHKVGAHPKKIVLLSRKMSWLVC